MVAPIASLPRPSAFDLWSGMWGAAGRDRFRGGIEDYARKFELGAGYALPPGNLCRDCKAIGKSKCRHFEVETARQTLGPLKAILDPNMRRVMVQKAVQTLGSLIWDLTIHHLIINSHYSTIIVFLDADDKAKDYCDKRLMPTLKANPDIAKLLPTGADRHDETKTDILFTNGKILRVCGLNDSNASSLSWEVVIIDEGWLHYSDGLMQKAIDRTKQVQNHKIIIVGQAGEIDEDQDKIWKGLDRRVPLTFECPCCGGRQEFEFDKKRPSDFKPTIPPVNEFASPVPPKPDTLYGLRIRELIEEVKDAKLASQSAYYECRHCGFEMKDTPAMRNRMQETYEQDYQVTAEDGLKYTPEDWTVGFWNPDPSSVTVKFSQTMAAFIKAKQDESAGNKLPIQAFWMNRWATAWSEKERGPSAPSVIGTYDPDVKQIPNEAFRSLEVDCQQDMKESAKQGKGVAGWFWWVAEAVDRAGNTFQIGRGFAMSWDELFGPKGVKVRLGIPTRNVAIDGAHWGQTVKEMAAKYRTLEDRDANGKLLEGGKKAVATWKIMLGDDAKGFKHKDGTWRVYSEPKTEYVDVMQPDGKWLRINLPVYRWSNFSVLSQLDLLREQKPGRPKFEVLDVSKCSKITQQKEVGDFTFDNQMNGHKMVETPTGRIKFGNLHPQQHYPDCCCMGIVLKAMNGKIGHIASLE